MRIDINECYLLFWQPYLVRTHNMSGEPKTGDQFLELMTDDMKYIQDNFGVCTIVICTDNGPDGIKMFQRAYEIWVWLIVGHTR